jgi:outer membrane protein assembly factor BamB
VGDECDSLFCFNPDGTIAWRHFIPYLYAGGITIGYDDRVYAHDDDSRFYCLNSNGKEEWVLQSYEVSAASNNVCALADSSTLAYDNDGECLMNIDYDGEVRWFYYLEDSLGQLARRRSRRDEGDDCATPAVGPDGNVYVCGYYLMCFACGDARLANTAWPTYNHDNARSGWAGRH